MSLSVKTRKVQGGFVMDMSGRLTAGEAVIQMRDSVRLCTQEGSCKLVLNLGSVSYIDSAGLGEIVSTYSSFRSKGGAVKLLNLTQTAKRLLEMAKVYTLFETYDDEGKAIESLSGSAAAG